MDPHARRFLAMVGLAGGHNADGVSVETRRFSFEKLMKFSRPPDATVDVSDYLVPAGGRGLPVRCYAPTRAPSMGPGLVFLHGGGLVAGSLETHDALCRTLAIEADCRIAAVGYRLAPEHPFPAALIDTLAASRWIARHAGMLGMRADRIAIGGDSGGATLAAVAAQVLRRRAIYRAQVLLCPVLDCGPPSPSRSRFAEGFLLDAATMRQDLKHYRPSRALTDPRLSPLRASDLGGLPPAIIHTAGFDPLRDEGDAYAGRLREAGVEVRHTCHESLVHHFYGLTGVIPAARVALSAIAADIRAALV